MFKVNTSECNEVSGMTLQEERFDLIDEKNTFKFQGNLSIFTKDGSFQRMGMCYYQHNGKCTSIIILIVVSPQIS